MGSTSHLSQLRITKSKADNSSQSASGAAAEAGYEVRICVDLWPQNISEHGLPQNKDKLIEQLIDAAEAYDIDGYEFDWEYPANATGWVYYGDLLVDLSDVRKRSGSLRRGSSGLTNLHTRRLRGAQHQTAVRTRTH